MSLALLVLFIHVIKHIYEPTWLVLSIFTLSQPVKPFIVSSSCLLMFLASLYCKQYGLLSDPQISENVFLSSQPKHISRLFASGSFEYYSKEPEANNLLIWARKLPRFYFDMYEDFKIHVNVSSMGESSKFPKFWTLKSETKSEKLSLFAEFSILRSLKILNSGIILKTSTHGLWPGASLLGYSFLMKIKTDCL